MGRIAPLAFLLATVGTCKASRNGAASSLSLAQVHDKVDHDGNGFRFDHPVNAQRGSPGGSAAMKTKAKIPQAGFDPDQIGGRVLQTCDSFQVTSSFASDAEGCYDATGNSNEYSTGTADYAVGDRLVQPSLGSQYWHLIELTGLTSVSWEAIVYFESVETTSTHPADVSWYVYTCAGCALVDIVDESDLSITCGCDDGEASPSPDPAITPEPTTAETPTPTETEEADRGLETVEPTSIESPAPSETPEPMEVETPVPTEADTLEPTNSPTTETEETPAPTEAASSDEDSDEDSTPSPITLEPEEDPTPSPATGVVPPEGTPAPASDSADLVPDVTPSPADEPDVLTSGGDHLASWSVVLLAIASITTVMSLTVAW